MSENYDVVVVGGGAAGLSGALALVRSRRSVLVVDAGEPRNAPSAAVHNYLTRDGESPAELYARGRAEVVGYGGRVETGRVIALARADDGFRVDLDDRRVLARRLLIATGSHDRLPDVPGLADRWGIDALHCPYCHGWEVRDRRIGVLAATPLAVHQASMFAQLSGSVCVLPVGGFAATPEQSEQLAALQVPLIDGEVAGVETAGGRLAGVRLADGRRVELDAVAVQPFCEARADFLAPLGLRPVEVRLHDALVGTQIEADPTGATAVPGVWVAGNVANVQAQVISSAAGGLAAGAAINADLIAEDTRRTSARRSVAVRSPSAATPAD
jgi:thioredoxin reductase